MDNTSGVRLTLQSAGSTFQVAVIDKAGKGGAIAAGEMRRLFKKRDGDVSGSDPATAGVAIWYVV